MNVVSKININGDVYSINDDRISSTDITNIGKINATDIAAMLDDADYVPSAVGESVTYTGGTGININNGEISIDNTVVTTSNIAGLISLNMPSITYGGVSYTVATQSTTGAVTIDGSKPVHVITLTGNASSVTLSTQPADGHSTHVFFYSTSQRTVAIAHNENANVICPGAENLSLTVKANGYVEVDFLKANGKIYVRGV